MDKPSKIEKSNFAPNLSFDAGDLDCGNGLLLLIRRHMDKLLHGQLLEIVSIESSVQQDLPSWCRLTKNQLVSSTTVGKQTSYLVCKGQFGEHTPSSTAPDLGTSFSVKDSTIVSGTSHPKLLSEHFPSVEIEIPTRLPEPIDVDPIPPLSVMGIGSWPRPAWMIRSLHDYLESRLSEEEFQSTADDAVRLCVNAQLAAGVDVITDGEQRRDNYASFVGQRLENCQLIPLVDLLALVSNPEELQSQMEALDVPMTEVRHPVVFGRLGRKRSIALHEFEFIKSLVHTPAKIALPGPYLLTRTMWLDCITNNYYESRQHLSEDIVRVLREELHFLLAAGVPIVQLDEPVLSEVVYGAQTTSRSFMCGALSERMDSASELEFATRLINATIKGLPPERIGLHVCRGNWTANEAMALTGDYRPLLSLFQNIKVGTLFLEFCTPRAGELEILQELPPNMRIGLGVVNPKNPEVESLTDVLKKTEKAAQMIGFDRLLLNPDCGFATFADNPVSSSKNAQAKLSLIAQAAAILKRS